MLYSKIIGLGSYYPSQIVNNSTLSQIVDTNDEWITTRTGIKQRRISSGENTSQMALIAAKKAIHDAAITKEEIDMVILSTITPDFFTPSTASLIQAELGLIDTPSFDISAGCTGFIYCVQIADQFIKSGQCKTILVIGAEVLSKVTNWSDRNTCVLFGDGAGAAILKGDEKEGIISTYTGSQGDLQGHLTLPAVPVCNPFLKYQENNRHQSHIYMNGKEIFKFATRIMIKSINRVLEQSDYSIDDIDYIIPHQANIRIIDYVSQKLKVDKERFIVNLDQFGNTSAASVPLAMDEAYRNQRFCKGDKIIMVAFGGGLTWGAVLVNWII